VTDGRNDRGKKAPNGSGVQEGEKKAWVLGAFRSELPKRTMEIEDKKKKKKKTTNKTQKTQKTRSLLNSSNLGGRSRRNGGAETWG